MTNRIPLIAGNWKMNLDHLQAIALIQKLSWTLDDAKHDFEEVEVAVFPPFTDLRSAQTLIEAEKFSLALGAQDISAHESGAYTGEVSGAFLAKLDVKYVLVGHSERRQYHAEGDEVVRSKVAAAWKHGLVPIICVGETLEELETQGQSAVPISQTVAALSGHESLGEFVIAYEPVWAIGTGKVATAEEAAQVATAIRTALVENFGASSGESRILYGGSVKANNVAGFLQSDQVDGVLVGGASLDAEEFAGISRFKKHIVL
ncbi:MAG: triose-phosphate isomerase [Aquiluna sp.]|nr:triose-phosphate isomerase [Aquiluna sp.]